MGNSEQAVTSPRPNDQAVATLRDLLLEQQRDYAWLSRESGVPYKRILAEVKHAQRPLDLETAIAAASALGTDLPSILG